MRKVQVEVAIEVAAPPGDVWDYTQDYSRRAEWDGAVLEARVESESPERVIWIRGSGRLECRFRYKLFERPNRTSLAMIDLRSPLFSGGGGSWSYAPTPGGTRWIQIGTLVFRSSIVAFFLSPVVRWGLARAMRRAMREAKRRIEGASLAPQASEARKI